MISHQNGIENFRTDASLYSEEHCDKTHHSFDGEIQWDDHFLLLPYCPAGDNLPSDDNDNTTATQNHPVGNSQKRADSQAKKGY